MSKRVRTIALVAALGFGVWALAVVDFVDVTTSFDDGDVVSATTFNEVFAAIQANFEAAKVAIEQAEAPSAGEGLILSGTELSLDTAFSDARYLTTQGGGVIDGDLTVNAPTFVGINRTDQVSSFEAFGIRTDYGANAWGGMYVETASETGRPFYGYSAGGGQDAWTEFHGGTQEWRLFIRDGYKFVVETDGDARIVGSLTLGGTLTENSDRASKHEVRPVDAASILAAVTTLPIATWRYDHSPDVTHIGPMADDFYAAFGVGHGPSAISTIDRDGVALAAIQALHAVVAEQEATIAALESRLAVLEASANAPSGVLAGAD